MISKIDFFYSLFTQKYSFKINNVTYKDCIYIFDYQHLDSYFFTINSSKPFGYDI